jgi:hypothetical protein
MTTARHEVPVPMTPPTSADSASQLAEPNDGIAAASSAGGADDESMVTVPLYRARRGRGVGLMSTAPAPAPPPPPPKPTVLARTLTLAHRLQAMLDGGRAKNRADLAAKLGFSRARITQIMNLLWLAPDIQEEILFSVSTTGRDVVTTRDVRSIVRVMEWAEQRKMWREIREAKTKQ